VTGLTLRNKKRNIYVNFSCWFLCCSKNIRLLKIQEGFSLKNKWSFTNEVRL